MSSKEIIEERISFPNSNLELEGILAYPAEADPVGAILLCTPHPHFAGNLDNNVIRFLAQRLAQTSVTLRFNYRGVGASSIALPPDTSIWDYWEAIEQEKDFRDPLEDTRSAIAYIQNAAPGIPTSLIGYSLGAFLALICSKTNEQVDTAIAISPPWEKLDFTCLAKYTKPCLVLTASDDFLFSEEALQSARCSAAPSVNIKILAEGGHFFRGCEDILAKHVAEHLMSKGSRS